MSEYINRCGLDDTRSGSNLNHSGSRPLTYNTEEQREKGSLFSEVESWVICMPIIATRLQLLEMELVALGQRKRKLEKKRANKKKMCTREKKFRKKCSAIKMRSLNGTLLGLASQW
ncbi:hypothetical protein C1H46_026763 [Malus baccata]|uniref:Uncharacterized protein n=1 Tax=Malus baccata TaxID=106549 RepID=A0A540LMG0_MALBA|nr:hypothetical protein C1H46_026763 [Malus baccata]